MPLNIFEPRYLKMIDDALKGSRMIGMIQPKDARDGTALYETGCAGKITDFTELPDGRYLISLTGICRFKIVRELDASTPYRQAELDWSPFEKDIDRVDSLGLDRKKLHELLHSYLESHGIDCEWDAVESAPDGRLITCLAMVCPFEPKEKQALLEAPCCRTRAEMFMAMLEMAVRSGKAPHACGSEH